MRADLLGPEGNHERNNRSVNGASALLKVEATAAKMEAFISGGICASLILVAVVPEGTFLTSDRFNIKDIADSIIVLILCVLLIGEPIRQIRLEFGRLSGRRGPGTGRGGAGGDRGGLRGARRRTRARTDARRRAGHRQGKAIEVDLRVAYTGTMSVEEQDELRAHTYTELRNRIGPLRLTLVFSKFPIHATPTA